MLATQRAELLVPYGRRARAEGLGEGAVLGHAGVDFLAVVEVIGERGVDVGERQIVLGSDFVGTLAEPLVPDCDVLHRDATPADPGLPADGVRRHLDVLVQRLARHQGYSKPRIGAWRTYSLGSEDRTKNFCTNNENVEQLMKLYQQERGNR